MGDPHNPARNQEEWSPEKLQVLTIEVLYLAHLGVFSGGWAWHFYSPHGHVEYKHAHDHKDVDVFVRPQDLPRAILELASLGYARTSTRFDEQEFRRYEKHVTPTGGSHRPVKVQIDLFIEEVPSVEVKNVRLVEPHKLLSLYGSKHSSDTCWAVVQARKILAKGGNIIDNPHLCQPPR